MIKWFKRRKYRKFIVDVFKTINLFIHSESSTSVEEIIVTLQDLLCDYADKYDKDDIYYHYIGRLEYFKLVKRWKEQEELKRRIIEE